MICTIRGKHILLTSAQLRELEPAALGGRSRDDLLAEMYGDNFDRMNDWLGLIEKVWQMVTTYLGKEEARGSGPFWAKYERFEFTGPEAAANVTEILHGHAITTRRSELRPLTQSLYESVHNKMLGNSLAAAPRGDAFIFCFDVRRRGGFGMRLRSTWDTCTRIVPGDVRMLKGEIRNFTMIVGTAELRCNRVVSMDLSPA